MIKNSSLEEKYNKIVENRIIEFLNKQNVKENKMKVGDYVRTNDGIGRITKYKYEPEYENCHIIWFDDNNYGIRYIDNEIKSSPNLIDLIEVGDIVRIETEKDDTNIFEVVAINYNDGEIGVFNNNFEFDWASIEQLKSIVTKEQFESMEYKIGE